MKINTLGFALFLGISTTLALLILAYRFIVPEKRRAKLNKLGLFLNDIFNFKFLIIEKIMQFLYVLATLACFGVGTFMLLGFTSYTSYYGSTYTTWYGWYGLLLVIVGPFAVRLAFESLMLFLLLVKNVIQINKKLKAQTDEGEYQMPSFKELISKENLDFIKSNKTTDDNNQE